MSGKKRSGGKSGADRIVLAILALALAVAVLNFIAKNIDAFLIMAVLALIAYAAYGLIKKKAAEEEKRLINLEIVNEPETEPPLTEIPSSSTFADKEEEKVNLDFRKFLKQNNDVTRARGHLDFLTKKASALRALKRNDEAARMADELSLAQSMLSSVQSGKTAVFESKYLAAFYKTDEIRAAYTAFASKLPNERLPLIGDFFQSPSIKIVKTGGGSALIFTPCYLLSYSGTGKSIRLLQYRDASVSTRFSTEKRKGQGLPNDEIERIGYLHETKDGNRDLRYSCANNPACPYVYRGEARIRCGGVTYVQRFTNKSLTEAFEKQFNNYLALVNGKYKNVVGLVLDHDEALFKAGSMDALAAQEDCAAALQEEQATDGFEGNSRVSDVRTKNKAQGEPAAKAKPKAAESAPAPGGLSDLSEEELRVIMEMRREKLAQKKAEEEKRVPEKTEYSLVPFDTDRVIIRLADDGRKITNNIFNLKFQQQESTGEKPAAEYETFVIDAKGQIISDIKTICADRDGADLCHKVTYSLTAQEKFDKSAEYYVVLRYKNGGMSILSKTPYQISIDFASDFDF